ncbi:MAG: hypothetical protein M3N18_04290 [Actinomycetota bacterium]|nr:hypothetical protein [Actinomycetota bacterium]
MKNEGTLAEVVFLRDVRGGRPENAVGIGEFWYEPEIWSLPLSPAAKVLYAGLCSFLGHGEIHRKDLRATLKDSSDEGIAEALEELVRNKLLEPASEAGPSGYAVRAIG